ncbi:DUF4148 domain-containing protein [Burkholderia gladioli pv. alliicola]|uniref:DUF4148 domain-containing protein n=1 Tax=Burkholderia gladioli TaxID=28095 RepID=UPI003D81ABBB
MKLAHVLALAALATAPVLSFAQTSQQGLTRAQVRAELVQLEQAGYNPASDHTQYPANIQAALSHIDGAADVEARAQTRPAAGDVMQMPSARRDQAEIDAIYAHS